jgi:hypothetical protein
MVRDRPLVGVALSVRPANPGGPRACPRGMPWPPILQPRFRSCRIGTLRAGSGTRTSAPIASLTSGGKMGKWGIVSLFPAHLAQLGLCTHGGTLPSVHATNKHTPVSRLSPHRPRSARQSACCASSACRCAASTHHCAPCFGSGRFMNFFPPAGRPLKRWSHLPSRRASGSVGLPK